MPSLPDSVGERIVFGLSVHPSSAFVLSSVRSSVRTDLVTTISHERLEQTRLKLQGMLSIAC